MFCSHVHGHGAQKKFLLVLPFMYGILLVSSLENLFDIVSAYQQQKIMVVFLHGNLDHRILSYVKKILKVPSKSNMSFWRKILKVTLELYFPANTKEETKIG